MVHAQKSLFFMGTWAGGQVYLSAFALCVALAGHAQAQHVSYVPQIVNGFNGPEDSRFFVTSFVFANLSDGEPVDVEIQLFDNDGGDLSALRPMTGPGGGSTPSVRFQLSPRGTQAVETSYTAFSSPVVGWARVTSTREIGLTATLQYRDALAGNVITSTSILPDLARTVFRTFVLNSRRGGPRLGLALLNPSKTEAAEIQVTLFNGDGSLHGTRSISLEPSHKIAQFFDEGELFTELDAFFGTAEISSGVPLAVAVIRVDGIYWSTFRVLPEAFE